jgi:hypothetical protein
MEREELVWTSTVAGLLGAAGGAVAGLLGGGDALRVAALALAAALLGVATRLSEGRGAAVAAGLLALFAACDPAAELAGRWVPWRGMLAVAGQGAALCFLFARLRGSRDAAAEWGLGRRAALGRAVGLAARDAAAAAMWGAAAAVAIAVTALLMLW